MLYYIVNIYCEISRRLTLTVGVARLHMIPWQAAHESRAERPMASPAAGHVRGHVYLWGVKNTFLPAGQNAQRTWSCSCPT